MTNKFFNMKKLNRLAHGDGAKYKWYINKKASSENFFFYLYERKIR